MTQKKNASTTFGSSGQVARGAELAVAGWFYVRTWMELGQPVVGNWNAPGEGRVWWQQPGFHTPAYLTGFGQALVHPYLSGFHSFWDGLYSTLWGDGYLGGRVLPSQRHPFFDPGWMTAGHCIRLIQPRWLK